jgi:energy-coupling factor transporter ATP-binding protein EcfA2
VDSFELGRLNDNDFEKLCKDLFEEILGIPLEVFPPGRDLGIDLRHVAEDGTSTIIQCRHWPRGTRARLISEMATKELPKIASLNPGRYILATSVELTVEAKEKLTAALTPYVAGPGDLYGADQIVEELRKRPAIVERHFRLWLSSTALLQAMLHKESLIRSSDLLIDLEQCARTFVPTPAFDQSKRLLAEQSVCIIAGSPGIGKTTIARMLAAISYAEGYEVVEISRDADDVNAAWNDKPQLFYYNDFLGRSRLGDKLAKNEDSRLLRIVDRIRNTAGKRLVLTTRDYLLKQAQRDYGTLDEADLSPLTFFVQPDDYSSGIRAQILYNLVYGSSIPDNEKRRFAKYWLELIYDDNFNPRIIENTVGLAGFAGAPTEKVPETLLENFARPERIWERVIEDELDSSSVHLLEVLAVLGWDDPVALEDLKNTWVRYRREIGADADLRLFFRALKIMDGAIVTIWSHENGQEIGLRNPSIQDYLIGRLHRGRCDLDALIRILEKPDLRTLVIISADVLNGTMESKLRENVDIFTEVIIDTLMPPSPCVNIPYQRVSYGWQNWAKRISYLLMYAESLRSIELAEHALFDLDFMADPTVFKKQSMSELVDLGDNLDQCCRHGLVPRSVLDQFATALLDRAVKTVREFHKQMHIDQGRIDLGFSLKTVKQVIPNDLPSEFEAAQLAHSTFRAKENLERARSYRAANRPVPPAELQQSQTEKLVGHLRSLLASLPDNSD